MYWTSSGLNLGGISAAISSNARNCAIISRSSLGILQCVALTGESSLNEPIFKLETKKRRDNSWRSWVILEAFRIIPHVWFASVHSQRTNDWTYVRRKLRSIPIQHLWDNLCVPTCPIATQWMQVVESPSSYRQTYLLECDRGLKDLYRILLELRGRICSRSSLILKGL